MTAYDVEFTLLRALQSPNVSHIVGEIDPEGIEVIDELTIRIATREPFAPLLAHLAHDATSILNETAVTEHGEEFGQNPIGTGPFIFENWAVGDRVELARNENFHGDLPEIDRLIIRNIAEPSTRLIELETGGIHMAMEVSPSDIARIENHDELILLREGNLRTSYIGFNLQREPFNDKRVRQAINYAIDTELIVETILEGVGIPAVGPIGPNVWGANPSLEGFDHNIQRAQQLLAEAGFENGFQTTLWTDDNAELVSIATVVRNQLQDVGIDVEIETLEWGTYLEQTAEGGHDMFILGWTAVTADADYGLFPLFHSSQFGSGGNRTFFHNDQVDQLLTTARMTNDPQQREALYFEIQDIIVYEAPWVFLNVGETLVATRENVRGFRISPSSHHLFGNVYFE